MTVLRACVTCGTPSPDSYCPAHKPKPWATSRRKEQVTVSGSAEQARRARILKRDLGICHVCDRFGADQVDHRIPLAEGGADEDWNLASIHAEPCHREKTAAEALRARGGGGGEPRTLSPHGVAGEADGARQNLGSGGGSGRNGPVAGRSGSA